MVIFVAKSLELPVPCGHPVDIEADLSFHLAIIMCGFLARDLRVQPVSKNFPRARHLIAAVQRVVGIAVTGSEASSSLHFMRMCC